MFSLRLSIHRIDESYHVMLIHQDPRSQAQVSPVRGEASFDLAMLRELSGNESNYGRALMRQLLADEGLEQRFLQLEAAAQAVGCGLRISLDIDPSAQELQSLCWEMLRHPKTGARLTTSENVWFSRSMASHDFRPVRPVARVELRALVVISAPTHASLKRLNLAPVDFEAEVGPVREALKVVKVSVLGGPRGPATLDAVVQAVRVGVDIVYLVSHGMFGRHHGTPALILQDKDGEAVVVKAHELTERIAELSSIPRLFVLASCQSAGDGRQSEAGSGATVQATLAGRLAAEGVPAVVGMQGFITMATVRHMIPIFFTELVRDGRIDRALTVARSLVRDQPDAWMPALFTRLLDGRLWNEEGDEEKRAALLRGLVEDMAGWGRRHVFGNKLTQSADDVLPFMPLEEIYVEPKGRLWINHQHPGAENRSIKEAIRNSVEEDESSLVVVRADFGHGKSLTARSLARDLALNWLSADQAARKELRVPIFIRCSQDMEGEQYLHSKVVRHALWKHAIDVFGNNWPMTSNLFDPPGQDQRVLFIFDGLDGISWDSSKIRNFFRGLEQEACGKHQAVVFTRPGVLREGECVPEGTPQIELLQFENSQVDLWIARWNRLAERLARERVPPDLISRASLADIARVPILLLMIAMASKPFSDLSNDFEEIDRGTLYRGFFRQIARGKLEQGGEEHPAIAAASKKLAGRLSSDELKILEAKETVPGSAERRDHYVDAMLWLMSRVAWEAHERVYRANPTSLTVSDIEERILRNELGVGKDVVSVVGLGLVLVMQLDPARGTGEVLFGHQSFREFLVAYYVCHELRRLISLGEAFWIQFEQQLCRVRLLRHEGAVLSLLRPMLRMMDVTEKTKIHQWAQSVANGERSSVVNAEDGDHDERSYLRETAIAIGSCIAPVVFDDGVTLRAILGEFDINRDRMVLDGPGLSIPEACLQGVDLHRARLERASLPRADLRRAHLERVHFEEANLEGAHLEGAYLKGAHLEGANLKGAHLKGANLKGAKLQATDMKGAHLKRALLEKADLRTAHLEGGKLERVHLEGADLREAHLEGAELVAAYLDRANLEVSFLGKANLYGASLYSAKMSNAFLPSARLISANLKKAILVGAVLKGAELMGASLEEANLKGASLMNSNLERAVLVGAEMENSWLIEATLKGANFSRAKLQNARLDRTDLTGAILEETNLQGTGLRDACIERAHLAGANMEEADLRGASLIGCYLKNAILKDTRLEGARYTQETVWPEGFEPHMSGAILQPSENVKLDR